MDAGLTIRRVTLGLGGACFALLAYEYGHAAIAALERADPATLALYLALALVIRVGLTLRWLVISRAMANRTPATRLAMARLAADGLAAISPAGRVSGDPLRAIIAAGQGQRSTRAAAAVALDRVVETLGNTVAAMTYIALFASVHHETLPGVGGLAVGLAVGLVALLGSVIALPFGYHPFEPIYVAMGAIGARWARAASVGLRRAERHVRDLLKARPWLAAGTFAGSLAIEVLIVFEYRTLFAAFGVDVDPTAVMMSLLAGGVSRTVPTPAGLGALEAGQVLVFGATIGRPEVGFAVGLVMRLHELLWAAVGMAAMAIEGLPVGLRRTAVAGKAPRR